VAKIYAAEYYDNKPQEPERLIPAEL